MKLSYRSQVLPSDPGRMEVLVQKTGFFIPEEIRIARELAEEQLAKGKESGYFFLFAEERQGDGVDAVALNIAAVNMVAYACYGPIPGTRAGFDLYWIAVDPACQDRGLGRELLRLVEQEVRCMGGARLYIDTSSREQYTPTRIFYERCGYRQEAHLPDFYAPGDGKIIFCKLLPH